jgi:hypothetical protein
MPKLPENTATKFDSPLRRTSRLPQPSALVVSVHDQPASSSAPAPAPEAGTAPDEVPELREAPVIALPRTRTDPPPSEAEQTSLSKRITVRIDDDIYRALELERLERRLAGDNANIAEVARKVLGAWAKRRLTRDRAQL